MKSPEKVKTYQKKMPIFWWTHRWKHLKFISRELTSLMVAFYAILFLLLIKAVDAGQAEYIAFMEKIQTGGFIIFHSFAFLVLLFHSITWFNLAPSAMVIKIGKNRVPDSMIALSNYVGWIIISLVILWLVIN